MSQLALFKTMLTVQLFWSFAVTILVATMPAGDLADAALFTGHSSAGAIDSVGDQLESNFQDQVNVPNVVDTATLVLISGNLVVDIILNFFTAIPAMFVLLTDGLLQLVPISGVIALNIKAFVFVIVGAIYAIGLMAFLNNIRTGDSVV